MSERGAAILVLGSLLVIIFVAFALLGTFTHVMDQTTTHIYGPCVQQTVKNFWGHVESTHQVCVRHR